MESSSDLLATSSADPPSSELRRRATTYAGITPLRHHRSQARDRADGPPRSYFKAPAGAHTCMSVPPELQSLAPEPEHHPLILTSAGAAKTHHQVLPFNVVGGQPYFAATPGHTPATRSRPSPPLVPPNPKAPVIHRRKPTSSTRSRSGGADARLTALELPACVPAPTVVRHSGEISSIRPSHHGLPSETHLPLGRNHQAAAFSSPSSPTSHLTIDQHHPTTVSPLRRPLLVADSFSMRPFRRPSELPSPAPCPSPVPPPFRARAADWPSSNPLSGSPHQLETARPPSSFVIPTRLPLPDSPPPATLLCSRSPHVLRPPIFCSETILPLFITRCLPYLHPFPICR